MKTKFTFPFLIFLMLVTVIPGLNAQVVNTKTKAYKKAVKQRTRDYEKQGYKPMGSGTINLYVTRGVNKEFETDDQGHSKYNVYNTNQVGPTFETAATACRASARATLAANIETRVAELIERSLANNQISQTSADGINKVLVAGKQIIAQRISLEDIYLFYRPVKDSRTGDDIVEVVYSACYSNNMAMLKAQEYIREQLTEETKELHEDLDRIFEFDE